MKLSISQQMLLTAICKLQDEAYGVKIMEKICQYTKREIAFGTLYNNLEQLIKKGYAESYKGEPTAIRGGKRKVYYRITDNGIHALQTARELQSVLWKDLQNILILGRDNRGI